MKRPKTLEERIEASAVTHPMFAKDQGWKVEVNMGSVEDAKKFAAGIKNKLKDPTEVGTDDEGEISFWWRDSWRGTVAMTFTGKGEVSYYVSVSDYNRKVNGMGDKFSLGKNLDQVWPVHFWEGIKALGFVHPPKKPKATRKKK